MRIKRHHPPHEENSHAVPTPCPLPNCNPLAYEYQGAEPTYHSSFLPAQGRTHHMLHTNPSHAPVLQNTLPPSSLLRSISTCTESESHYTYVDYNTKRGGGGGHDADDKPCGLWLRTPRTRIIPDWKIDCCLPSWLCFLSHRYDRTVSHEHGMWGPFPLPSSFSFPFPSGLPVHLAVVASLRIYTSMKSL